MIAVAIASVGRALEPSGTVHGQPGDPTIVQADCRAPEGP